MASMRKAINQHCKDCIYDDMSGLGTWRQQTEGCTVVKCALYEFRPRSVGVKIESNGEIMHDSMQSDD